MAKIRKEIQFITCYKDAEAYYNKYLQEKNYKEVLKDHTKKELIILFKYTHCGLEPKAYICKDFIAMHTIQAFENMHRAKALQ